MSDLGPAIVIMAKAPRLGHAKSRLRSVLSDEEAETLSAAFFVDTVNSAKKFKLRIIIAFTPSGGRDELCRLMKNEDEMIWLEQRGSDLGERLVSAIGYAEENGFGPLLILGTDSPNLPAEAIASALTELSEARADIVLGPTADGGYYLIGLNGYITGLLSGIKWSSEIVFQQTAANAARLGLSLYTLPTWYDVDTPEDLQVLRTDLSRDPESAPATHASLTHQGLTASSPAENISRQAGLDLRRPNKIPAGRSSE